MASKNNKNSKTGKRKNRSSDFCSVSSNNSPGMSETPTETKRHRSTSVSVKQGTLTNLINTGKMTTERSDTTFTAGGDDGNLSICDQLKNIEQKLCSQIHVVQEKIKDSETNIRTYISDQFEKLRGEFFDLQQENSLLKEKLEEMEDQVEDLQDEVAGLKKSLVSEREERNNLEQYQRRDSVRFLGVGPDKGQETLVECEQKILTIIHDKLGLPNIQHSDISIAHRVGARRERPRPIIVKFVTRKYKSEVIFKRRLLKGSGISIVEDLTPTNMNRLSKVKNHPCVKTCWTKEGNIFALLTNGNKVHIHNGDLEMISRAAKDIGTSDMEVSVVPHSPHQGPLNRMPSHLSANQVSSTPKVPQIQQAHGSQQSCGPDSPTLQSEGRGRAVFRDNRARSSRVRDSPSRHTQGKKQISADPDEPDTHQRYNQGKESS